MEESGKLGYRRCSPLYEVTVSKSDGYDEVVSKLCSVLDVQDDQEVEIKLFTAGGSVIPNSEVVVGSKTIPWTVGSYLNKKHISPDKLKLGIGYIGCSTGLNQSVGVVPPSKKKKLEIDLCSYKSKAKDSSEKRGDLL